jgi:6-phosphogluconolactonase (cycloisomerase 2 family)
LSQINTTAPTDSTPSDIILDPSGTAAFVLNIGSSDVTGYTVNSNGSLTAAGGNTPITAPSPVSMARDAAGKFLFVASLGSSPPPAGCAIAPTAGCPGISVFSMQSGSATLSPLAGSPFLLGRVPTSVAPSITVTVPNPKPTGPAELTGPLVYVTGNQDLGGTNDNTVSEFVYDVASSTFTEMTNSPYSTASNPSAVLAVNLAPVGGAGGVFVYTTNMTTNNVSIFEVCTVPNAVCPQTDVDIAKMTPVGSPVSVGQAPVAMTVDSTNNFFYVVNRNSNSVSGFRINQTTGGLTALTPPTVSTGSNPVALTIHSSGKFLYVSNSGSDNISGFNVSTVDGALSSSATVTSSAQPAGLVAK